MARCRREPVIAGLSCSGDEAGGRDEGEVAAGFSVTLPTLSAETRDSLTAQIDLVF